MLHFAKFVYRDAPVFKACHDGLLHSLLSGRAGCARRGEQNRVETEAFSTAAYPSRSPDVPPPVSLDYNVGSSFIRC